MPIKRGTKVIFTGFNISAENEENESAELWRDKQIEHYYNKHGIEVGNKGKTCGGYNGGWVRITWTLSDGSKVSSVPMRSENFSEVESPHSEHLIDFEEPPHNEVEKTIKKPMLPVLTSTEQVYHSNLMSDIRKSGELFEVQETPTPPTPPTTPDTRTPCSDDCFFKPFSGEFCPIDPLRKVLKQTRVDNSVLVENEKKLNNLILGMERSIIELSKKNAELENYMIDFEDSHADSQEIIKDRDDQIDDLKNVSNSLNSRLEIAEKETGKYITKYNTTREEIGFFQQDLEAADNKCSIANSTSIELSYKCSELRKDLAHAREQVAKQEEETITKDEECQSDEPCYFYLKEFDDRIENMNDVVGKYKMIIDVQQEIMVNIANKMTTQGLRITELEEKNEKNEAAIILQSVAKQYIINKQDTEWQVTDADF